MLSGKDLTLYLRSWFSLVNLNIQKKIFFLSFFLVQTRQSKTLQYFCIVQLVFCLAIKLLNLIESYSSQGLKVETGMPNKYKKQAQYFFTFFSFQIVFIYWLPTFYMGQYFCQAEVPSLKPLQGANGCVPITITMVFLYSTPLWGTVLFAHPEHFFDNLN